MIAFLKSLAGTFYSADFYKNLALNGRGIGMRFIFVAIFLSLIATLHTPTLDAFFKNQHEIFASLPDMRIRGGVLSVQGETPLHYDLLTEAQGGPLRVVIDPSVDTLDKAEIRKRMDADHLFVLVGARALAIYDLGSKDVSLTTFEKTADKDLTAETWRSMGQMVDMLVATGLMTVFAGFGFLFHLATVFLGATLVMPLSRLVSGVPLTYKASLRLTAASKVPVAFIGALPLTSMPALQVLIWFGFAAFGLLALRTKRVGKPSEIS